MAPQLLPEYFLHEDQIAQARQSPVLTPAQLHLLRQQIDTFKRINVQLRALKYKARTGQELPSWAAPAVTATAGPRSDGGRGGGRGGRGRGGRGSSSLGHRGAAPLVVGGRGRGRGRGRGSKRGREDESEDDDSIVVRSSEEEEEGADDDGGDGSSDEDGSEDQDASDMVSADSSESEDDFTIVPLASPRRTGRVRRLSSAAAGADLDSSDGDGGSGGEEREEAGVRQQAKAAPERAGPQDEEGELGGGSGGTAAGEQRPLKGAGRMPKQPPSSTGKSGGVSQGSSGSKRKGLFMVVSEDTASKAALHLPQLKPVRLPAVTAAVEGEGGPAGDSEEDAVCGVCGDGDAVEENLILLCEGKGCSVVVHQLCYGVAKVPEGKWLCDGCKAKLKPGAASCCVCPVVGGALRKVTSLGRVVPPGKPSKSVYCHLACALWVPEIEVSDHSRMAGLRLDKLTAVRAKLRCELCKQAGGAAIQCSFGTCCRAFHVLCGRAAGQQLAFRNQDGEPLQFCGLHSKPTFEKMVEQYIEGTQQLELHGGEAAEEGS